MQFAIKILKIRVETYEAELKLISARVTGKTERDYEHLLLLRHKADINARLSECYCLLNIFSNQKNTVINNSNL